LCLPCKSHPTSMNANVPHSQSNSPFFCNQFARCSNANRTDMCVMVFKCPDWPMVEQALLLSTICIFLQESPLFLNIDDLYQFLLPHEESAGACQRLCISLGATKIPNPLYALHAPPFMDSEVALLATIRHSPHTLLQLPLHLEGRPWWTSSHCSWLPCQIFCVAALLG
jgi:hypothetical protein